MSDNDTRPVRCQNCGWTGTEDQTLELRDFWSRIEPGDVMPAGDCPACGSAAMLENEPAAIGQRLLHLTQLARRAQLTVSFNQGDVGKRNCIAFLNLEQRGKAWAAIFSCATFDSAESWLRKYIDTLDFAETDSKAEALDDWTKTVDCRPPELDSVLGRWIARRQHHIVIHNPEWAERDENGAGRTWRVFRPNDDTGEPIDPPDYWQHLTLPRAEFDPGTGKAS